MRPDQFRRGDDLSHRFVCAFGLLLSIEREADKWPTLNADDVEAVTRCASDICGRINLAEIVAVHIGNATLGRQIIGPPDHSQISRAAGRSANELTASTVAASAATAAWQTTTQEEILLKKRPRTAGSGAGRQFVPWGRIVCLVPSYRGNGRPIEKVRAGAAITVLAISVAMSISSFAVRQ